MSTAGPAAKEYDVTVIGGGPHGIGFATWVKKNRPQTRIAIVEKRAKPGYKIGESTRAPSVDSMLSLGPDMPMMRRLFQNKLGLHFWWTGPDSDEVGTHINASDFDETFQLERRVLETMLLKTGERHGIDVYRGTEVDIDSSEVEGPTKEIRATGPDGEQLVFRSQLVCDASGPASLIPSRLGLYSRDFGSFNTNAYFGYFRKKGVPDEVVSWDVSATNHLCFPEGWVWFIDIASWERAPQENLDAMVDHLLDLPDEESASYPTRYELSEQFGCPVEEYTSIGVVVRADVDTALDLPAEQRFQHYVDRYPGFTKIMDCYELIPDAYDNHPTYAAYMDLVHRSTQCAGDGWVAVGDAAFFVNPFLSPGLAYGAALAHLAAQNTVKALEAGDVSRAAFAEYERAATDIFAALIRELEMFYRGFRDSDSYERTQVLKYAFSVTFALARMLAAVGPEGELLGARALKPTGRVPHPTGGGILNPDYTAVVSKVVDIAREAEASGEPPAETSKRIRDVIDPFMDQIRAMEGFQRLQIGKVFMDYDDELNRVEKEWSPLLRTWRCTTCRTFNLANFERCHVCGTEAPEGAVGDAFAISAPAPAPGH